MDASRKQDLRVISHRGQTSEHVHENTLEAFQQAVDLGADAIETDVRQTKDRQLVCTHDRSWNGQLIKNMTYDEWKRQTVKKEGWRPPLLSEVLSMCEGTIPLNLEIKEKGLEEEIVKGIPVSYPIHELLFSSFDDTVIEKLKQINQTFQTALVIGKSLLPSSNKSVSYLQDLYPEERLRKTKADAVCPYHLLASKAFIARMHRQGYEVNVWTVNSKEKIRKLKAFQVDAIFTDDVKLALSCK
ncbi:glycerophosphoryl diester phosphodiesterase [Alteribacillus persepolensis]|uniref:Glycerophosphoryl diester phosphodiesterase n=1 Tax=Alteribacillus persepolensis TaxID=568899 RepID=A0A1G8DZY7_9BACI|nr:glycerophosphodiester phosphodiesterase [Alteribacillus persepolensis]SDH63165.1 glycerophosphoryl diester phosphodiesterase [Alteribacillus persepolensis]